MAGGRARLTGLGVSAGTAAGPVARLGEAPRPPADEVNGPDPATEVVRAEKAFTAVAEDLEARAASVGGESAQILTATAMLARDPGLWASVKGLITSGTPTAHAVDQGVEGFCTMLEQVGGYMGERVADLRDVRDRTLAVLLERPMPGVPHPGQPYVLVADDLAPADTATLDPGEVLGIVTAGGGPTSHTAILAKSLGIPAVVRCGDARTLAEGATVVVDGSRGEVLLDPTADELDDVVRRREARAAVAAASTGPGRTADGHPVALLVNVGTVEQARAAGAVESEGVGLFRTEFLFLDRRTAPTVEEQVASYTAVFEAFAGRRVVLRTLDAGADKPMPFVTLSEEPNPALGVRGLRTAQRSPEVLADQLTAVARAAEQTGADVRVMAPMVATPAEAVGFAALAREHGIGTVGVMVEVPAAALRARAVLAGVDFVSLGTNDLTQYAMAADREAGDLAELLDPWQPALLDLVASTGAAGEELGKPVGVCGEAASDPLLALVLVGLGVSSLSMAPGALPAVRHALGAHTREQCRELARLARAADDAAGAKEAVRAAAAPEVVAAL
ncbi:phosphoenolpyruvate--protein phosphotransferase [Vallicoccus soli]|uniref:Phosphoenolpyruvate-protein phosphotransferase n=1 Tax=Vallicoccus soli TaxID=2339232 RepID=A0A3A3Z123_9ACTN|nr:phosphoenolpyruvate--protein phosphotransferase [Vallicoccus soli]RJK96282.1 phosphoenolpyruvate--protein phosphotransferase [Vallicoccus soli]